MPYLIPDDWNGEDWTCVQIQWPNSKKWMGILRGVVSEWMRGRNWDETTGSIKDTQAIGWEIWDRNYPFTACEGENGDITPPVDDTGAASQVQAFSGDESDFSGGDFMPGSIMGIRCENGVLQVQYFPCCDWVDVCDLKQFVSDYDDEGSPYPDPAPTGATNACRKAYGSAKVVVSATEGVWAIQQNNQSMSDVFGTYPQYAFDAPWLSRAWEDMKSGDYSDWSSNKTTYQQELACLWSKTIDDNSSALDDHDFADMKTALAATTMPNQTQLIVRGVMEAMKINTISNYALAELENESADCTCPHDLDPIEQPTASGWYAKRVLDQCQVTLTADASKWTGAGFVTSAEHDVFGLIMDIEVTTATGITPMGASHAWTGEDTSADCGGLQDTHESVNGDSSGQESDTIRYCHGCSDALDEIFGAGTYNLIANGRTWSCDPATPSILAGLTLDHYYRLNPWKSGGTITFKNVYLVYNENSPSHA